MGFVSNIIRSSEFVGPVTGLATSASFASTASYLLGSIESASFATTASYALTASKLDVYATASYALTASYVANASSFPYTGSANISGSLIVDGDITAININGTASYALTASYLSGSVNTFPYSGSAVVTGSLTVTGSIIQTTDFGILASGGGMTQTVHVTPGYAYYSLNQPIIAIPVTADDSALFIEYSVKTQPVGVVNNIRAGVIACAFNPVSGYASFEWSDNSTADIGDTSDFEFGWSFNPVDNEMALIVDSTPNNPYKVKLIVKKI